MTYYQLQNGDVLTQAALQEIVDSTVVEFTTRAQRDLLVPAVGSRKDRMRTYLKDEGVTEVWYATGATWVPEAGAYSKVPSVLGSGFAVPSTTTAGPATLMLATTLPKAAKAYRVRLVLAASGSTGASCSVGVNCSGASGFLAASEGGGITGFDVTAASARVTMSLDTARGSMILEGRVVAPSDNAVLDVHVLGVTGGSATVLAGAYLTTEEAI